MKKFLFTALFMIAFVTVGFSQHLDGDKGKTYYDEGKTIPKEVYSYKEVMRFNPNDPTAGTTTEMVKHGPYFFYYESGKLKISGQYADGNKHGEWKYYDEAGKITKTEKYLNGSLEQ